MKPRTDLADLAAGWVARIDRGLTPQEQAALDTWLSESPRHREAFVFYQETYRGLDRSAVFRPSLSETVDPDLALLKTPSPRRWPAMTALAAAAALAVGYFGWFRPTRGAVDLIASTEVGRQRPLQLPDGSTILLNTASNLHIAYTGHDRQIHLTRGEAYFKVAKNPSRPFLVSAGAVTVRALGTEFNVRINPGDVEVVVTEGRVSVRPADNAAQARSADGDSALEAGSRIVIPNASTPETPSALQTKHPNIPEISPVPSIEMSQVLAWRDQRLIFDPTPLRDVVKEFNRYVKSPLVLSDEGTGSLLIGGAFRSDDPETFVRVLETHFGIKAERLSGSTLLRRIEK